jgi:hypothetical protein
MSKLAKPKERKALQKSSVSLENSNDERFAAELSKVRAKLKPWNDAIRESQRLNEDDFAVRINARD